MLKSHGIRYLLAGLVAFFLSYGLMGCGDSGGSNGPISERTSGTARDDASYNSAEGTDYNPCAITFTSPVNGTVLKAGTTTVTIKGYITAGDSAPQILTADGATIPFNKATGAFSYTYDISSGAIYSTSTVAVTDKNSVTNKNRISFAVGESLQAGATGVVSNAARVELTQAYMDELEEIIPAYVGKWKNDMIYGYTNAAYGSHDAHSPFAGETALLPMAISLGSSLGTLVIDNARSNKSQGFLNIGPITMALDIQSDDTIRTDITIASASGINPRSGSADAAIFIEGSHQYYLLGNPYFAFYASGIDITGATLSLSMDATSNQVVATLDTTGATITFTGANYEYGLAYIPDWLSAEITGLVASTLKAAINVPIMKASSILYTAEGITDGGWPMNTESLFTSTDTFLTMDLGMYSVLEDPAAAVVGGLSSFYATPDGILPIITMTSAENVDLVMTDDIMNNFAYTTVQSGYIKDVDVTAEVKEELTGVLGKDLAYEIIPSNLKATLSLETPPVFDFSTDTAGATGYPAGRIIIRNLLMDISFDTIDGTAHLMKLSADVDGPLTLTLGGGGYLVGGIDTTGSTCSIMTLYSSDVNAELIPAMEGVLANVAMNRVLKLMIGFEPPSSVDLYGVTIGYTLVGTEVSHNCLIIKGLMTY
ncbi:MAG: hypothetical protein ABFD81_13095 [Syntrophaceae bacterium]